MAKSAQEVASKWARRAQAATQDLTNGINSVKEAPGAKAAAKQQKMLTNITAAIQSGKWADRVSAVTLADWKKAMIEKGVSRYGQGVQAAEGKMQNFMSELLPYQESLKSTVSNMPDLTLEDSIARMSAWTRGMANFKKS